MNGEGFAFFRWRVACYPYVGDDAGWWEFYKDCDFDTWRTENHRDYQCTVADHYFATGCLRCWCGDVERTDDSCERWHSRAAAAAPAATPGVTAMVEIMEAAQQGRGTLTEADVKRIIREELIRYRLVADRSSDI